MSGFPTPSFHFRGPDSSIGLIDVQRNSSDDKHYYLYSWLLDIVTEHCTNIITNAMTFEIKNILYHVTCLSSIDVFLFIGQLLYDAGFLTPSMGLMSKNT